MQRQLVDSGAAAEVVEVAASSASGRRVQRVRRRRSNIGDVDIAGCLRCLVTKALMTWAGARGAAASAP